ncbi:MAG: hypothetical protein M3Y42_19225, partial [Actinomycetota bacterium]|nr:hypothetical protein [Actinomycetota bacterium]
LGAALLTIAASLLLLLSRPSWPAVAVLIVVAGLVALSVRSSRPDTAFRTTMICAACNVGLIVASGSLR